MANEKINTTQNIITAPLGDSEKEKDLLAALESIPEEDIMKMWAKMDEAERKREEAEIEKLKWDTDAILNDLKENYVMIEEDAEMMWYKWKKVHIDLPAIWNFEWFKFDYFVSENSYSWLVGKKDFWQKPRLKKKLYSIKEISKLLHAMNKYMIELKWINDGDMDYENKLKYWEAGVEKCNAWDCLKTITWLDDHYWLVDKYVQRLTSPHIRLACRDDTFCFDRYGGDVVSRLLLKLSD